MVSSCCLLFALPLQSLSQGTDPLFEDVFLEEGVPTDIQCVLQDQAGYLWAATASGLYRYDGCGAVAYRHGSDDSSSLFADALTELFEDRMGVLWVGSRFGLERMDRASGTFSHFAPCPDSLYDPRNEIWSVREDRHGGLWVASRGGLFRFDRLTETFTACRHDSADPASIAHDFVPAIHEDRRGTLWFGTWAGLDRLDPTNGTFVHCVPKYAVRSICEDTDGTLWLGTTDALVAFTPSKGTVSTHRVDPQRERDRINMVCQDAVTGRLWIGTRFGLFSFTRETGTSRCYLREPIPAVCYERSGTLWAATGTNLKKLVLAGQPFKKSSSGEIVYTVRNGTGDTLWAYTSASWKMFDTRTGRFMLPSFEGGSLYYVWNPGPDFSLRTKGGGLRIHDALGNVILSLDSSWKGYLDSASAARKGRSGYWVGLNSGDLDLWEPGTNRVIKVMNVGQGIYWIFEDRFGLLWIVTEPGRLFRYDHARGALAEVTAESAGGSGTRGIRYNHVHEDARGRLWFASNDGLRRYDRWTNGAVRYSARDGLSSENVLGILEDEHGFLWLNTPKGISKFDPEACRFRNYDASDGIEPATDRLFGIGCRTRSGEMFFPGGRGITRFHPDSVRDNPFVPPIVVTSFKKFDRAFPVPSEIRLAYDENFISFEFAALSYIGPGRNQYAYMMEGLDREWVYSGTRRAAFYPGLAPGEYVFRVKGSNNHEVWNETGVSIPVIVTPPVWKSAWAYGVYATLLVGTVYLAWKMRVRRIATAHAYEMSRFEAEKLREVDTMKSRFFANISHEFRTPLTLVLGPIRQMIETTDNESLKGDLQMVQRSAASLLGLVNQLLDLSRLESGCMKLRAAPLDVVPLLRELVHSFCLHAERKRIAVTFSSSEESLVVYVDMEKIQKVVTNVLGNAFKFTPEGGRVELSVARDARHARIRISDSGIGIPAEKLPRIFDRFYQVDGTHARAQEGTGIGLSLTRELVGLHRGTINVESEAGRGSVFTISLPLGRAHLRAEEVSDRAEAVEADQASDVEIPLAETLPEEAAPGAWALAPHGQNGRPVLLIVDDNRDVREFIRRGLEAEYDIVEAVDGADGWNRSLAQLPDVIISDIMMPKMDGFEFCDRLKADERTSHIPVILLTAKASPQDRIEGFQTGADDYILKPFDQTELRARLRNLLEQRKRLHAHFRAYGLVGLNERNVTSADQKFLQKAVEAINDHLADASFGVETFAAQMAVSRSLLCRKLESLVGEPPSELIKRTRLNRGAKLIEARSGNISEIALEVGFANPAYFAECFRKQFGCPPSHYPTDSTSAR
jgi:signal transduction histidine kinase/ligand-binding sensor domain-containing protein/CheY-like chemotaxis protein